MPKPFRSTATIALFSLAFSFSATAGPPDAAAIRVDFRTVETDLILVPVTINGAGPFNFILDTGSSVTMVDRGLAGELSLPVLGADRLTGPNADERLLQVRANSLSLGGATVDDLTLMVRSQAGRFPGNARGMIGEDFLAKFDLLLDYRHHRLELQRIGTEWTGQLQGERLPVSFEGWSDGDPTPRRLIVSARASEISDNPISLLLDSGANALVMLRGKNSLSTVSTEQRDYRQIGVSGYRDVAAVAAHTIPMLHLGKTTLFNLTASAPPPKTTMDVDGLLPTSLFHSIFISHSHGFVIFDPKVK